MMKAETRASVDTGKKVAISLLFVTSASIALLGIAFCVYSTLNQMEFTVLQNTRPGAVFGVIIAFLGVRYFMAVLKLRHNVYNVGARFSWSNFKKH